MHHQGRERNAQGFGQNFIIICLLEVNRKKRCTTFSHMLVIEFQIISLTRPRISRPWFDRPPSPVDATTLIAKKNTSGGSARSNSSSGCSSDPQSGPSSPISSKCSSEGGSNARCRQSQQQQNGIIGQRQKETAETAVVEVNRQPQMVRGKRKAKSHSLSF